MLAKFLAVFAFACLITGCAALNELSSTNVPVIHPSDTADNSAGAQLQANRLLTNWNAAIASASFTTTAWAKRVLTPLIANCDFSTWPSPPATPTGWTIGGTGAAITQDTVNKYGSAAYSVSWLNGTPQQGQFYQFTKSATSGERAAIAGKTVTLAMLIKQPSSQLRSLARITARLLKPDGSKSLLQSQSGDLIKCYDGWMLHCISGVVVDESAASDANT